MKNVLLSGLMVLVFGLPVLGQQPTKVKIKTKSKAAAKPAAAPDWSRTYAKTIRPEELRQHLTVIASDEFLGREAGQPGQKLAADYLVKEFAALGLQGPVVGSDNPHLQHFPLTRATHAPGGYVKVGNQRYEWLDDFFSYGPMLSAFPTETVSQPVFVGFGVEQGAYSDYAGLDVQGKDVVAIMGDPQDERGRRLLKSNGRPANYWDSGLRKAALAKAKGARSIFLMTFSPTEAFRKQGAEFASSLREPVFGLTNPGPAIIDTVREDIPPGIGVYLTSQNLGLKLAGTTLPGLLEYARALGRAGKPVPPSFQPPSMTIHLPQKQEQLTTENVLGFLEGSDKKDEVLVISSHYDHLGVKNDTIYNGADDDGSGTVAVLAIAKAFAQAKAEGHGPRRSILFISMTAEEEGLFGSEYYTANPVVPLANTIANLNIDMVGRTDRKHSAKKRFVNIVGSDKLSSELHRINETANRTYTKMELDYRYNVPNEPEHIYYRSDHYNFARRKIPVIFYTTGEHEDYHKATDDVEKIEFDKLAERAQLVFHTAWELVNREKRIVVDSNKP
ncbi:M28 family peptidase [Hymenobacter arizonensis]|uniref:Zn-dependent amino-or carboxypeptidase, M28 family n=1 Tax=Hymenobacter arizonensis TaxID=1227077 RepID=A0A1I5XPX3_HYMAR|nr:M28 family peptidase [Hymenobacter arizonensis]SFQ33787.1 Zn-dependent amino-or carboxypeptidase, M28 family [Hymenobacter arizonensis]